MNEKYDEKQGEPVLAAEGLIRNYTKTGEQKGKDEIKVLKGLNFQVDRQEFVGIMGRSGCGKTTLLKILGMIDRQTDGKLYFKGSDTEELWKDELADIRTAVSEAVTNCIVHAYPDAIGEIILQARLYPEGRVVIKIRDRGCGIEDIRQAMEPLFTTGGEERSGLGFSVMESFSDKLKVTSRKGKGTVVTLEKYIAPRERQAKTN